MWNLILLFGGGIFLCIAGVLIVSIGRRKKFDRLRRMQLTDMHMSFPSNSNTGVATRLRGTEDHERMMREHQFQTGIAMYSHIVMDDIAHKGGDGI